MNNTFLFFAYPDIDECIENHGCHFDAVCTNTLGSYRCQCKTGYDGDGVNCQCKCSELPRLIRLHQLSIIKHSVTCCYNQQWSRSFSAPFDNWNSDCSSLLQS